MHPPAAHVERIFVADAGRAPMRSVEHADAVAGRGLAGDRYGEGRGSGAGWDECEVTLIEGEHLDRITAEMGVRVLDGEHRRNLVTRGVRLERLEGREFRVGDAVLVYDRPRPPCRYIASITEPMMTKALGRRSGVCARVLVDGPIRVGDAIVVIGE